jgi:agmatine deiminase
MPAEWEPHAATWLAWPHNVADWPGKFGPIPWVWGEIIRRVVEGERVRLMVNDSDHEARARRVLARAAAATERIDFLRIATNRVWTRDYGPIFVRRPESRAGKAIVRFRFNAWANYADWRLDDAVPPKAARRRGLDLVPVTCSGREVVLEGGAIDVNGRGSILTTEECLLDPKVQVRNPGFTRADYETVFREALGAPHAIWLNKGISGDDTHGHVDDLARFVDARTIVLCRESNPDDPNYAILEENRERLEGARLEDGSRPGLAFLPMPEPVIFAGRRLPASYANFYVTNAAVLVPTFNDPADRIALGVLAELFAGRRIVGIHALDLVWGLGTLHCLSQQEPA